MIKTYNIHQRNFRKLREKLEALTLLLNLLVQAGADAEFAALTVPFLRYGHNRYSSSRASSYYINLGYVIILLKSERNSLYLLTSLSQFPRRTRN
jgi:hypothetical protein